MTTRPPREVRQQVIRRAEHRCEHCRLHQDFAGSAHQVDHVIAEKHGGPTTADNLALSCTTCNRRKGSDLGAVDPQTQELVRLYNPRSPWWEDHFRVEDASIVGITPEGRTTVELLRLNSCERMAERAALIHAGRWRKGDRH